MHENSLYYASADSQYWPVIRGVASLWGGFVIPKNYDSHEVDFFKLKNVAANPPLIAFHGALDTTVPFYDKAYQDLDLSPPPLSGKYDYNSENFCTYQNRNYAQLSNSSVELKGCSSLNLHLVMNKLNRFSELYVDCQMAHGLDDDVSSCKVCAPYAHGKKNKMGVCEPCTYESNFGTMATNQTDTIKYIAERIAVFSQAIMVAYPALLAYGAKGRGYFKDCENYRICTDAGNNNACGSGGYTLCDGNNLIEEETE